jgi:Zn-dependent protease
MAFLSGGLLAVFYHANLLQSLPALFSFIVTFFQINLVLAIFNLIPIYPLDGQKVLSGLLPREMSNSFEDFSRRYGSFLLIGLIIFGGRLISLPLSLAFSFILSLFGLPV